MFLTYRNYKIKVSFIMLSLLSLNLTFFRKCNSMEYLDSAVEWADNEGLGLAKAAAIITFSGLILNKLYKEIKASDGMKKFGNAFTEIFVDNFYEVSNGLCYRSGQLPSDRLEYYIKRHHIKAIVNLRDEAPGQSWYQDEIDVCNKLSVKLENIGLNIYHLPPKQKILELLDFFDRYKGQPILIHCRAGVDRTGLASFLWLLEIEGKNKVDALKQLLKKPLAFWKGHYVFVAPNMKYFADLWQNRDWLINTYNENDYQKLVGILERLGFA